MRPNGTTYQWNSTWNVPGWPIWNDTKQYIFQVVQEQAKVKIDKAQPLCPTLGYSIWNDIGWLTTEQVEWGGPLGTSIEKLNVTCRNHTVLVESLLLFLCAVSITVTVSSGQCWARALPSLEYTWQIQCADCEGVWIEPIIWGAMWGNWRSRPQSHSGRLRVKTKKATGHWPPFPWSRAESMLTFMEDCPTVPCDAHYVPKLTFLCLCVPI